MNQSLQKLLDDAQQAAAPAVEKAAEVAENVGAKVLETAADIKEAAAPMVEKAAEMAENVGAKVLDTAAQAKDYLAEKWDSLQNAANEMAAQAEQAKAEAQQTASEKFASVEDAFDLLTNKAKNWLGNTEAAAEVADDATTAAADPDAGKSFWDKARDFVAPKPDGDKPNV